MTRPHLRLALLSAALFVTACGGAEVVTEETTPESVPAGDDSVQAFSACTVTLTCGDGSTLQCSSAVGNCQSTSTSVTCDGVPRLCRPCAPSAAIIQQSIPVCYPSRHPFGRYYISNPQSGVTYTWSSNYADLHWDTGTNMNLSATSVGWFTLTVTATRAGCPDSTVSSANFYAASCSGGEGLAP